MKKRKQIKNQFVGANSVYRILKEWVTSYGGDDFFTAPRGRFFNGLPDESYMKGSEELQNQTIEGGSEK